jgi:hypothetical protein
MLFPVVGSINLYRRQPMSSIFFSTFGRLEANRAAFHDAAAHYSFHASALWVLGGKASGESIAVRT